MSQDGIVQAVVSGLSMHAVALGIGDDAAVRPILQALLAKDLDHTLEHALTYALIEIASPRATR